MAVGLQVGEFVTRLKRAFQIRGAATLDLESSILPVANLIDLNAPPFRTDGIFWQGGGVDAGTAGNLTTFSVQNGFPDGSRSAAVVDRVIIYNPAAVAVAMRMGWGGAVLTGTNGFQSELSQQGTSGTLADKVTGVGIQCVMNSGIVGTRLVLNNGSMILPASSNLQLDGPWYVPSSAALYFETEAALTPLRAIAQGRFWRDVG